MPPSIPDPKYSYGFEEDDDGNLIPHDRMTVDTKISQDLSTVKENVCDVQCIGMSELMNRSEFR